VVRLSISDAVEEEKTEPLSTLGGRPSLAGVRDSFRESSPAGAQQSRWLRGVFTGFQIYCPRLDACGPPADSSAPAGLTVLPAAGGSACALCGSERVGNASSRGNAGGSRASVRSRHASKASG